MNNPLHSKKTPRWGTPSEIIELARQLLGHFDLDPASSPQFNTVVKANQIYTEGDNGLTLPWLPKVFLNPPGGLVKPFWHHLHAQLQTNRTVQAFWVGFSLEQLATLVDPNFPHPLNFPTVILRKRLKFSSEEGAKSGAPTHSNYLTAIGVDPGQFENLFSSYGKIVLPTQMTT